MSIFRYPLHMERYGRKTLLHNTYEIWAENLIPQYIRDMGGKFNSTIDTRYGRKI